MGLYVEILGATEGRVVCGRAKVLEIKPSKSYTLFRILTKPEMDEFVEYTTPPPGQYKAIVPWFEKYHGGIPSCEFSIVRKSHRPRR